MQRTYLFAEHRLQELKASLEKSFNESFAVCKSLYKENDRQSADQEELLGEQEDAVKEVLQTQSGLSEVYVIFAKVFMK